MKNLLCLLVVLFLVSCGTDNTECSCLENSMAVTSNGNCSCVPFSNNLIGVWQVTKIVVSHPQLGQEEASDIKGTITFRDNGSGKEDYSFTAVGINFDEKESFNWIGTNSNIITDPGTEAELVWDRSENTEVLQVASYTDENDINYTLTLEK